MRFCRLQRISLLGAYRRRCIQWWEEGTERKNRERTCLSDIYTKCSFQNVWQARVFFPYFFSRSSAHDGFLQLSAISNYSVYLLAVMR